MQKMILRTSGLLTSVILLVCALTLPLGAKQQVTRPVKGVGYATVVVDLMTGQAAFTQWGQVTHLGLWTDVGEGVLDETLQYFVSGHGTVEAANGDTIDWEFASPTSTRYISGTGRFHGVAGGPSITLTSASDPVFNGDGTMTTEFSYTMVGEITY